MEYIDPEFIISHVLNKNNPTQPNEILKHSNSVLNSVRFNEIGSKELNLNNLKCKPIGFNKVDTTDLDQISLSQTGSKELHRTKPNSNLTDLDQISSNRVTETKLNEPNSSDLVSMKSVLKNLNKLNSVNSLNQSDNICLTSTNIIVILIVVIIILFMLLMLLLYKLYQTQSKLTKVKNKYSVLKLKTQMV